MAARNKDPRIWRSPKDQKEDVYKDDTVSIADLTVNIKITDKLLNVRLLYYLKYRAISYILKYQSGNLVWVSLDLTKH